MIQMKEDTNLDQRGGSQMGEMQLDLEYILEMESAELGDRFDV